MALRTKVEQEYITAAEFGRWRTDFIAFRAELSVQLRDGFKGLADRLDDINGRGRENATAIEVLISRLDGVDRDDGSIKATVQDIQQHGCAKLREHGSVVQALQNGGDDVPERWPRRKQVAIGGGLLAGGAGLWELIHAALDHFMTVGK